ncbi:MAG: cupin domain-containing protein [Pseudomonadota bacterium]
MRKKISPIDPATLEADTKSTYPEVFQKPVAGRRKRRLAPLAQLKHLSAVHVELPPGCASSLRVWHSHEDELIIVTEGELTLVTDDGEEIMRAGHIAGFPAGAANGHQIVNRSGARAAFVEVASFDEQNTSTYPDHDLLQIPDGRGRRFVRKDGTPY